MCVARCRFRPDPSLWPQVAPTWNETLGYRHEVVQGVVSDGNTYAMGGVSGHAGLFSTAHDTYRLMRRIAFASPADAWLNASTVALFTTVANASFSSRALGWDTNSGPWQTYQGCGNFSANTFTHTGFSGACVSCTCRSGDAVTTMASQQCGGGVTCDVCCGRNPNMCRCGPRLDRHPADQPGLSRGQCRVVGSHSAGPHGV